MSRIDKNAADDLKRRREILFKEADLIQSALDRMFRASFLVKGWAVTISIGIAWASAGGPRAWLAAPALLAFWWLDAFFLHQERLYRALYLWVITRRMSCDDFALDLRAGRFERETGGRLAAFFSPTLLGFYGMFALLGLAAALLAGSAGR